MKYSESWLGEWVKPRLTTKKLCDTLTLAGFEVEGMAHRVFDIAVTPNRGDCLSIRGMAREIASLTRSPLKKPLHRAPRETIKDALPVRVRSSSHCPRYLARIIRHIPSNLKTPDWMEKRLMESGFNLIHPLVDVTHYVMLELGQPMHAFDLNKIKREINVRLSKQGESIELLDGSSKLLNAETLIIADQETPLAIAGLMGGLHSGVSDNTSDILLESAYFLPSTVAKAREYYHVQSESSMRFERGIDPTMQRDGLERATALIFELAEVEVGPVIERVHVASLPKQKTITLTKEQLERTTGIDIKNKEIENIFNALHFTFKSNIRNRWAVKPPAYRHDLSLPEDLIEEVMRLYGYHHIPAKTITGMLYSVAQSSFLPDWHDLRQTLSDQGYHEIISYSFVDRSLQLLLNPDGVPLPLTNPISQEMAVMRTNLWPGLLQAFQYNQNRQQQTVHLFEIGSSFCVEKHRQLECSSIAGLLSGSCYPEQWGIPSKEVDFYDIKGHVEAILKQYRLLSHCQFQSDTHPALHPGQTASIHYQGHLLGWMGALHPTILQQLKISDTVWVFELDLARFVTPLSPHFRALSPFPLVRRDIAILIRRAVPVKDIQDTIKDVAGHWLKKIFVFDVYQGEGVPSDVKSVALGLLFQHETRTLLEEEVNVAMDNASRALLEKFGAMLRS